MAIMESLTGKAQIGQLCAARHQIRVARYQAFSQKFGSDRSQCFSSSVSESVPAAMARQGCETLSPGCAATAEYCGGKRTFQSRGMWGFFQKGLQSGSPSNNNNNFNEDVRMDTRARAREPESAWEPQPQMENPDQNNWPQNQNNWPQNQNNWPQNQNNWPQNQNNWPQNHVEDGVGNDQALSVVEVKPDAVKGGTNNAQVAGKALDQSTNVATSALEQVGDVLKGGLEVQLDLGLKELTVEKLVLRDLGLVLEIKTKPKPEPVEPEPVEPEPPTVDV